MKYKKAMKDFESLSTEEQTNVIMQIGSKLTGQEIWYWEGIVHLLREQDNIIKEVREYIENIPDDEFVESEHFTELLEILERANNDK